MANHKHVLVAYTMRRRGGSSASLEQHAAVFAAEATLGAGVPAQRHSWDSFVESCGASVYHVDEGTSDVRIAYHAAIFDRSLADGRVTASALLATILGSDAGSSSLELCEVRDVFLPAGFLRLFPGPAVSIVDAWRVLGRHWHHSTRFGTGAGGGLVVGCTLRPISGLVAEKVYALCRDFWSTGDLVATGLRSGSAPCCPLTALADAASSAMRVAIDETGEQKLFIACIAADETSEMIARGHCILERFGPLAPNCGLLVGGPVEGGGVGALAAARRAFPGHLLFYHGAEGVWQGSPGALRGYSAFVHAKLARLLGAGGVRVELHAGTLRGDGPAAPEGAFDIVEALRADDFSTEEVELGAFSQEWCGMRGAAALLSGGAGGDAEENEENEQNEHDTGRAPALGPLHLPALFERLGHADVVLLAGDGILGHSGGPRQGAAACRQAEKAWHHWRAGAAGQATLPEAVIAHAQGCPELAGAFRTWPKLADRLYPGWRDVLGAGDAPPRRGDKYRKKKAAAAE